MRHCRDLAVGGVFGLPVTGGFGKVVSRNTVVGGRRVRIGASLRIATYPGGGIVGQAKAKVRDTWRFRVPFLTLAGEPVGGEKLVGSAGMGGK